MAHTQFDLQHITISFAYAAHLFELIISLKKTEVLHYPAPRQAHSPPRIIIEGTELNVIQQFTYLGSVISRDATINKEIDNRLAKASNPFFILFKHVWKNHNLQTQTKVKVYRAVVIPTLLYGAESCVIYCWFAFLLERFNQHYLHTILRI